MVQSPAAEVRTVVVSPRGALPFELGLSRVPAVAYPPLEGAASDAPIIDVLAAIRFVGRATSVSYSTAVDTVGARGMAKLVARSRLDHVRARADGAVADVVLGDTARVHGVELPCSAIDLVEGDAEDVAIPEDATLTARSREIYLFGDPSRRGVALRLTSDDPGRIVFSDLTDQVSATPMVHVALASTEGSVFEGWVWRSEVTANDGIVLGKIFGMSGSGCDTGEGILGPDQFLGPARIAPGATVLADALRDPRRGEEGRGAWATTLGGVLRVLHRTGEHYARILSVPGVGSACGDLEHAYVDAAAVAFPARHKR